MTLYPRFMLAAGASGSGKTMITCGILQALKNRGLETASFKCGPDYIDPLFHEKVIGARSRNLDTFFTDEDVTRYLFARTAAKAQISVMEGVMGYYDGLGGTTDKASAFDLSRVTDTPVVLIVNTKGMSLSILAYLKGYLSYRENSNIKGVILNQMSPMLYPELKEMIETELGVHCYGYVPKMADCNLESRHLGLVLPGEVEQLEHKIRMIAEKLEETLELDELIRLAEEAPGLEDLSDMEEKIRGEAAYLREHYGDRHPGERLKIAVSRDEAFCFIYEDNMELLRDLGAELIGFSPLHDEKIPEDADGVMFFGGYPELYAKELSENLSMRSDVRDKISGGMPCMAECGGFMYLHTSMEDMEGCAYPAAGVIEGNAFKTGKLSRFGYIELTPQDGQEKGYSPFTDYIRGHEFHYFDSTSCGDAYQARKPLRKRKWSCLHETETMLAGFPHLYYHSNIRIAVNFLEKCWKYHERDIAGK